MKVSAMAKLDSPKHRLLCALFLFSVLLYSSRLGFYCDETNDDSLPIFHVFKDSSELVLICKLLQVMQ